MRHWRASAYINLYILSLADVETSQTPVLRFAHREGELLYCSEHYHFRHTNHPCDFVTAFADAKFHFDTFRMLGLELIEQAHNEFNQNRNVRLAALFSVQAAVYFYHTVLCLSRMRVRKPRSGADARTRTLSTQLMLVFDDNHIESIFALPCLPRFLQKAPYDRNFVIAPEELEVHMARVENRAGVIEKLCECRIELYAIAERVNGILKEEFELERFVVDMAVLRKTVAQTVDIYIIEDRTANS